MRGHGPGVWEYGYGYFLTCLEVAGERDLEDLQATTWAVRFGESADKQAWQKFMSQGKRSEPQPVNNVEALAAMFGAKVRKQGKKSGG